MEKSMQKKNFEPTFAHVAILGFTCSLGPFATNGIVPSFHAIATQFGLPLTAVQEVLTVYLIALALGSLIVGALSDAIGRRPVLILGMALFAAASVGALHAGSITEMEFWRFLQGLGASVGQVVTQAMVRDRWSGLFATRAMSIIGMLFSISPAVAPIVGGWLVVGFGWKATFWFLVLYSLSVAAVTVFFVEETLEKESRRKLNVVTLFRGYAGCLTNRAFFYGIVSNGLSFTGMILVVAAGADFVVNVMGFAVNEFAYLSIPLVIASVAGSSLAPAMVQRFGSRNFVVGSFLVLIAFEAMMTVLFLGNSLGYFATVLLGFAFSFIGNLVRPVVMTMNLDYHPKSRGLAASVQQAFHTLGFALSSSVLAPLCAGAAWKYALAMVVVAILSLIFWLLALSKREACLPEGGAA